jgi:hypothetical protein
VRPAGTSDGGLGRLKSLHAGKRVVGTDPDREGGAIVGSGERRGSPEKARHERGCRLGRKRHVAAQLPRAASPLADVAAGGARQADGVAQPARSLEHERVKETVGRGREPAGTAREGGIPARLLDTDAESLLQRAGGHAQPVPDLGGLGENDLARLHRGLEADVRPCHRRSCSCQEQHSRQRPPRARSTLRCHREVSVSRSRRPRIRCRRPGCGLARSALLRCGAPRRSRHRHRPP